MNFLSYPNPLLPSEEDNVPPFPFPGVLETVQTSRTPQQINDDNDNRLGWREWISQSFPHGKLIAVEPFMSVDFSKSEDLQIQTVANQADDIAESLQNFELSEISEGRCRLILNLSDPIVVPSSNHAISQQLRSILQKRRLSVEVAPVQIHQKPKGVIYFLGTGSASPSRHRSNSAILCRFNSLSRQTSLLLDAGEGCVSQLFQSCQGESTRMRRILQSLSIVWISHHHADHHCGLSHLLEEMLRCNRTSKLLVIAPSTVISYHQYIVCVGGFDHLVEFIPIELTLVSHPPSQHEFSRTNQQIMASTNLIVNQFQSIRVPHCHDSFGLMFTLSSREKFVYSGDCRPSKQLVLLGMNCHLLIHEATFEDDRSSDAKTKRHSTISEGIQIGIEMRAKHTILTHLSQRYPRTPSIDRESNVTIAHDFLQVLVL
jgi:ribonuclease BN (tRNA processing enzyme)